MTKAEKWKEKSLDRPGFLKLGTPEYPVKGYRAEVSDSGGLVILGFTEFTPQEALALADWIISTFGEEKDHVD